ncbi:hypothetical protein DPMN_169201 [Dreissena polymorpha]|uniref:Uncharacterized protein n=2 Tax=Dreissena polymorpha TaxID=45954 RepID=A0A9D4F3A4_DREPO|nr:hypothetical protein DPMN_169201 [Dreissena polymorpha]
MALLLICGDVESNPGPPKSDSSRKTTSSQNGVFDRGGQHENPTTTPQPTRPGTGAAQWNQGVVTRQMSISTYTTPQNQHRQPNQHASPVHGHHQTQNLDPQGQRDPPARAAWAHDHVTSNAATTTFDHNQSTEGMFDFLRIMKHDLTQQNITVSTEIGNINSKLDSVLSTVNELKSDNEKLKQDNMSLHHEISQMKSKLDQYESQSRRNNLRFNGISGNINEQWSVTEEKLRNF